MCNPDQNILMGNPLLVLTELLPLYLLLVKKIYVHLKQKWYVIKKLFHKSKRYVINTELHILYFFIIYYTLVYFVQEYIYNLTHAIQGVYVVGSPVTAQLMIP